MAIRKRGKIFYIDYYYNGRRIRERVGASRKLAEKALAVRKASIAQGKFEIRDTKTSISFAELCKKYLEYAKVNKKSWRRDEFSIKNLMSFFENKKLNQITRDDVEKYKMKRYQEVRPSSVNREISCCKRAINVGIDMGWTKIRENVVRGIKMFKEESRLRYLTYEEADRLIECCNPWLKPIVFFAIYTGLRRNNILNLMWKNLDLENNLIILEQTKSGYSHTIEMGDSVKEFLLDLKSKSTSEYVFLSSHGKSYKDVKTPFKTAVTKAGIKNLKFHDLRHTYGTWLRASGADLLTIKELMGHRSLKTTEKYSHAFDKFKMQRVNIMQRRFKLNYGHKMVTIEKSEGKIKTVKH